MISSLSDAFTVRAASPEDAATAAEIVNAEETELRGSSEWGGEELGDWWRLLGEGNAWIVDHAAAPVAFAALFVRDDVFNVWVSVHPDATGRGLATALLDLGEVRARELGARTLHAGAFAENEAGRRLLERRGYRDVRHYFHMEIDLDPPPPPAEWPPGFTVSTFRPEDARAFYDALNEAFAEEWNWRPLPFDEWVRHRLDADDFDPDIWFLVREGEEVVAVLRGEANRFGGGFVGAIGVRERWRRRGLALALLRHAFAEFRRRGETKVGLGVDGQNPTGATRLYERAGMHICSEDIAYARELP